MNRWWQRKTPIAAAISLTLGASPVVAQQEGEAMEEIIVTGIRQSLRQSMDVKRNRDGVVDAITSEDIGDFPDSNLAESLQRITGVSIDRQRGEGSRVTVRGFGPSFNLVLLNGRQMPTSSVAEDFRAGRSFDFGNLASENIAAVEVYKSGQADVPSGGIGSTLNIRTIRPLDASEDVALFSVATVRDRSTSAGDDYTPELSGLFSRAFADGKFGIALSASYQERDHGANTASVGGWRSFTGDAGGWGTLPNNADQQNRPTDADVYSVPQSIGYDFNEYEQERLNGQLTLQWRPSERLEVTLDHTYAEFELDRRFHNYSAWFNFGGQQTLFTDGPIASPSVYTEFSGNSDFSMGAGIDAFRNELSSTGLNLVWDVTERLSVEFDHHDSNSTSEPNSRFGDSALLSTASFTRDVTTGRFEPGHLPILELTLGNTLSADDVIVTGSVFNNNLAEMDIAQSKLQGSYDFDTNFIESVDFGIQLTEVDYRSAGSVVQRDAWGGVTERGAISDLLTPSSATGRFDRFGGSGDPRLQTDFFTWDMAEVIARTEALFASGEATITQLADMGDCGTGLCPSSRPQYDRRTAEETDAFFVQLHASTGPVSLRLGVRYEETDVSSTALSPSYTALNWVAGNELTAVIGPEQDFTSLEGNYDAVLPNFDFQIDLREDLVGRISWSRTLTRPNFTDIQGGLTINNPVRINGGMGNRGNPALNPFESDNLDLSLEWYYSADSYIAVGYFQKDVENFIGSSSVTETPFNLPHPGLGPLGDEARAATGSTDSGVLYSWILQNRPDAEGVDADNGVISGVAGRDPASPFNLTIPVSIEQAKIDGWEFVIQHNFGDSGFGVIVNATIVDADVGYDDFSLEEQFVLSGLSDSANLIAFYEKDGFNIRVAYNWRDDFLAGTGQTNVGSGPPTYVDEYQQWDVSLGYDVSEKLDVFLTGINLTDETRYLYGRDRGQTLFATQLGPRYQLGVRYRF